MYIFHTLVLSSIVAFNPMVPVLDQNILRTHAGKKVFSGWKQIQLVIWLNALHRSYKRWYSLRAHLFLSYHVIQVPWFDLVIISLQYCHWHHGIQMVTQKKVRTFRVKSVIQIPPTILGIDLSFVIWFDDSSHTFRVKWGILSFPLAWSSQVMVGS